MDPHLIEAYRAAHYLIHLPSGASSLIQIGQASADIAQLYAVEKTMQSVLISAHNPHSQILSPAQNNRRHRRLQGWIHQTGWPYYATESHDPRGEWPVEDGFLVLGANTAWGHVCAETFEQNAFLSIGPDCIPHLEIVSAEDEQTRAQ